MLSFFRFLARHTAYLFFLLYCGISVLLMQLQQKETLEAIRSRGLAASASLTERLSGFGDLFSLRNHNERLLLQNARLLSKTMRQENALRDARNREALLSSDTTRAFSRFMIARVVDRRFSLTDNMLVIDAGRRRGVAVDMTVLTPDGLVGRVIRVSDNYAKVMPVINPDFKVSVVSDSSATYGVLAWKGGHEAIAHLENVPSSSHLKVGERLTTSDHSTFATRGIPIGRVVRVSGDKLFSDVDVRLFVDYSSLSCVLVSPDRPSAEKLGIMNTGDSKTKAQSPISR